MAFKSDESNARRKKKKKKKERGKKKGNRFDDHRRPTMKHSRGNIYRSLEGDFFAVHVRISLQRYNYREWLRPLFRATSDGNVFPNFSLSWTASWPRARDQLARNVALLLGMADRAASATFHLENV